MRADEGLLARMTRRLRQWACGLRGHDALLHFDEGRISLLCYSCGYESPGWECSGSLSLTTHRAQAPVRALPINERARVA